jgi:hypothetical protein
VQLVEQKPKQLERRCVFLGFKFTKSEAADLRVKADREATTMSALVRAGLWPERPNRRDLTDG